MPRTTDLTRRIVVLVAVVGFTVGAGCGGDDDAETQPDATPTVTTPSEPEPEDGTGDDFPIDAAPGFTASQRVDDGQLQLEYPADDLERVVAFYEDWTDDDDDTFERFDGDDGSVGWRNDRPRGDGFRAISVAQFVVGSETGVVTLAVLFAE